jgi:hypothetical protein
VWSTSPGSSNTTCRKGNGSGELIVPLTTVLDPGHARADELAGVYNQRWKQETGHDQLKTHLGGPGRVLRSRLPDLVHQEIWTYLIVQYAISALTVNASAAADLDPDRISSTKALRLIRRSATGTADIPPPDWTDQLPKHLTDMADLLIPPRRAPDRPRAVNNPGTTTTASRSPANPPASTTTHLPRSAFTPQPRTA